MVLKIAVARGKIRPSFDGLSTNGFFETTRRVKFPFALSRPRSGRVEGFAASQLRFSG